MTSLVRVIRGFIILSASISFVAVFMLGTLITVQIDKERAEEYARLDMKVSYLTANIDNYCGKMDRRRRLLQDLENVVPNKSFDMGRIMNTQSHHKDYLVYIKDLEQMWCLVPKAASTSWSKLLLQVISENGGHPNIMHDHEASMKQNKTPPPLQTVLRTKYKYSKNPEEYERATNSEHTKKILLVRHPFARLVSAYEDKLKNRTAKVDSLFFYQKYSVGINRKFRPKDRKKKIRRKEPTFEEFINYIIHNDPMKFDEHWQPISILCGLCTVHYDHIIRQEDLEEMAGFHLVRLGFSSDSVVPHQNRMGTTQVIQYYKNISRRKMLKLFKVYEDDFSLFDYKFLEYYVAAAP